MRSPVDPGAATVAVGAAVVLVDGEAAGPVGVAIVAAFVDQEAGAEDQAVGVVVPEAE
jgi:hypothetical protein